MPNRIPDEIIEEVKKSNDIVDVIGEYVQLKKQGRNYFGLCPFHGEKTPSFSVTQEKQIFHCFGCGKGGNVMTFIMEMENYSFYEAMQFLADKSGVVLPKETAERENDQPKEDRHILSAFEWLTKLYHHLLRFTKDGKTGYQYLKDRGISEETIDLFQLGFAPNIKNFTAEFLIKKGFQKQTLVKAGLLSLHDDNSVSDRFRGRVIFPIRNHLGKTIAYGGRAIGQQDPKYLNSPESELFQKGRLFYNFDLAKKHIRANNEVVLMEGYVDVISAYQAGVKNVVATMGTALSESQAKLLRRYVDTVIICYDSDNAGIEAAYKAANILRKSGCLVKITQLEEGMDPDDYIKAYGPDDFKTKVIQTSDTYLSFYMRYMKRRYNLNLEGDRIQYIEVILKELAMIDSPVEREYYLKELSNEHGLSMHTLNQEMTKLRQKITPDKDKHEKKRYTNIVSTNYQTQTLLPAFHNAERKLLAYMLKDRSIADKVQREIGGAFNVDKHKIITAYLYAYYEEGHPADVSLFIDRLQDEEIRKIVIEIALTPAADDISDKEINDYIKTIRTEFLDVPGINQLKRQQQLAEQQDEPIKAAEIAMQIIKLQRQLKHTNDMK